MTHRSIRSMPPVVRASVAAMVAIVRRSLCGDGGESFAPPDRTGGLRERSRHDSADVVQSPAASTSSPPSSSASIPAGAKIDGRIQVGVPVAPRWLAADDTSLWVHEPTSLVSVDLATSAVTGQVNTGWMEYGYAATGGGSVWQTDYEGGHVLRIDPVSGKTLATIPVGLQPLGVVVTAGGVWVANEHSGSVTRIDPATDKVVATIPINSPDSAGPQIMTAGPGGGVWVGVPNMGSVVRIDAATNKVGLVVPLDGRVASDGVEVWIAVDAGIDGLPQAIRIDPDSGKVITAVDLEQDPGHLRPGRRPRIRLGRHRRVDADRPCDGTHRRAPRSRWRLRQRRRGGWLGLGRGGRSAVRAPDLAAVTATRRTLRPATRLVVADAAAAYPP